ncbi:hypothetical protein [Niabella aurantiaca]|nr:hypothetical protein [Niabella aurantiaca]
MKRYSIYSRFRKGYQMLQPDQLPLWKRAFLTSPTMFNRTGSLLRTTQV